MSQLCFLQYCLLLTLLLLVSSGTSQAEEPARTLPESQPLDLFLLIGQSNMAGRGVIEAEDTAVHPRVWALTKANDWAPAKDPLHFDKPEAGAGLGLTFGKTIAERNKASFVGLIPCAVGGTSIDQWKKGDRLYDAAVKRAKLAMAHGRLVGILWHQGEADSTAESVAAYPEKLTKLVEDLRKDLDAPKVPVLFGELGSFRKGYAEFNKMLNAMPRSIPTTATVAAADLEDKHDGRHFNSTSLHELGRRYAAAYLKLTGGGKE